MQNTVGLDKGEKSGYNVKTFCERGPHHAVPVSLDILYLRIFGLVY